MIGILSGIAVPSVFASDPDFEIKTSKDILKFCEFFYNDYIVMGAETLAKNHPNYPNIRACGILYNHVAWKSTHPARDKVLIAEIEKYLGDSKYIKERHLRNSSTIPTWIKNDAKMWVRGGIEDVSFAYGIRAMLEDHILNPSLNNTDSSCSEGKLCIAKSNFIKYSYSNKYGQDIKETYTIDSINDNEILIKTEKISRDGKEFASINMDNHGTIPANKKCCVIDKFIFLTPISFGDMITTDLKVIGETSYDFKGNAHQVWIAQNSEKQDTLIIDKETGLVFSDSHKETGITITWEKTELVDTNIFEKKYLTNEVAIPKWFKTITMWLGDNLISESEYLNATENLLERGILRV
ncbi:hypothetical protein LBMAG54_12360 [Nitrosopumilaceae archaeon]|nr:hypothetical protein LBMAG54_12360 [Nitrosopumilaceae archaeon]